MRKSLNILFLMFVFMPFIVNAETYITSNNAEIECIYGNGIVVGLKSGNEPSVYVDTYSGLSATYQIKGEQVNDLNIVDYDQTLKVLENFTCPSVVYVWRVKATGDSDKTLRDFYNFETTDSNGEEVKELLKAKSGWWIFSSEANEIVEIEAQPALDRIDDEDYGLKVPLVGERIYITGDLNDSAYYLNYVNKATQAFGNNKYLQVIRYAKDSVKYFVKRGNVMTSVMDSDAVSALKKGDKYLCLKESTVESDSSRADAGYKFSSIKHEIKFVGSDDVCPTSYVKYEIADVVCKISGTADKESFCDKYSNTAKVLIKIIQAMQIIVPVVVIVITCIDIFKLVVSGDIVEELPKRKKLMIVRLVVMVFFFLLPTLTKLIISTVENVDIMDVSCLFSNDDSSSESYEDEDCVFSDNESVLEDHDRVTEKW